MGKKTNNIPQDMPPLSHPEKELRPVEITGKKVQKEKLSTRAAGMRAAQGAGSVTGIMVGTFAVMEAVFRMGLATSVGDSILLPMIFVVAFAAVWALVMLLVRNTKAVKIIGVVAVAVNYIMFSSQLVYNHIFKTFYTTYSMFHGAQVAQFWKDILLGMKSAAIPLIFMTLAAGFSISAILRNDLTREVEAKGKSDKAKGKAQKANEVIAQERKKAILTTVIMIAACIILIFSNILLNANKTNSAYDMLVNINNIDGAVKELGLPMAMCLDAGRAVFGFDGQLTLEDDTDVSMVIPVEYADNVSVDFNELIANEADADYKQMHQYFASVKPTAQNEMTGVFSGKNLIFITGESFSSLAIDPKYTPTLYKLQHEGYCFEHFYNPIWGVSTSDGEYVATQGLLPKAGVWSMQVSAKNYLPYTMGNQFKKLGYKTLAYHNHYAEYYGRTESHPNMGYEYHGLGTGLKVTEMWPESDLQMMELTCENFLTPDENGNIEPFHIYYMTVSGHLNYNFAGQAMCKKHQAEVADLDMSTACKAYIACNIELDQALAYLLDQLETAGVLDDTVICMSGDHYPYGLTNEEISEFLGHDVDPTFELYKSSLILYNSATAPQTIEKCCSSLDIIPTLSNLFGLDYDSRLLMGRDIFSDAQPLVIFKDQSWMNDKFAYNATTGEVFAADGISAPAETPSEAYIDSINSQVSNKFNISRMILEKDYFGHIQDAL